MWKSFFFQHDIFSFFPGSITLWFNLLYAGMGRNKHVESAYLKKKQESKKEMTKYKVSALRGL